VLCINFAYYRLFARSHFVKAIELGLILIVYLRICDSMGLHIAAGGTSIAVYFVVFVMFCIYVVTRIWLNV
jgi:hypothetical protein